MTTSAAEWLERFSEELGVVPPTDAEVDALLALAAAAAHASERTAAPISCWLIARSGHSVDEAVRLAELLAAKLSAEAE
jgi:hypothetical protein